MVAVKDADSFIARADKGPPVVLVYGPDSGLVRERADALLRASVDNLGDPFAMVRLEGDELASDPGRLVDEATTIPLFGGRRAISVRGGARNFLPAIEALLARELTDCRVVIEAGDLKKSAPLRALCEKAGNAAAIPCYVDNEQALGRLIDTEMKTAGLAIAADARAALVPLLGGDRRASLSEIRKLAIYAHDQTEVTLDDVHAVVDDASAAAQDAAIDAAFAGAKDAVETHFAKARSAGTSPGSILSAALRQAANLHRARLATEHGTPAKSAMFAMRPPPTVPRQGAVEAALRLWSSERLERVLVQLGESARDARRQPALADALSHRALLAVTGEARRKK